MRPRCRALAALMMESYIVRIYRREQGDAVAGVLEDALSRRTIAYRSITELSEWLRRPSRRGRRPQPPALPDVASTPDEPDT